jgi:murein DD-endopeptidase MepM/ murein hydrolase activator NlpD
MKKNVKYYFNPETLTYDHFKNHKIEKFFRFAGLIASFTLIILLIISISVYRTKSPDEKQLRQEVQFYKHQLNKLNEKYEQVNSSLTDLEKKDNEVYRVIFEADPLPASVLDAGTGGTEKYRDIEGYDASAAIITSNQKLDGLSGKLSVLTQSYKELMDLAVQKKKMLSTLPAIQPVANKDLKEIASGFGMRIHPIYHTLHMHEGLDFAAPKGTKVYATGDGIVEKVEFNGRGFGNFIVINHGFGYETLYGHLSKQLVRPGQKVKRGSVIGLVGSTGLSTAPHLHYEVVKGGKKVNPINYFHNDLSAADYERLVKLANRANKSFD